MTYEQLLELSVDLMVKRDRWEWGESDEEFTAQDAQALRHINRIMSSSISHKIRLICLKA